MTATATARIIASTTVGSIDYPDSVDTSLSSHSSSTNSQEAPTALLDPRPLSNGDGVILGGHTLHTGEAITLGRGSLWTTLSLQTQASGETLLAFGTSDLTVIDGTGTLIPAPIPSLWHMPNGGYRIGTKTLVPGSAMVATADGSLVTYSMLTRGSTTLLAMGKTRTIVMLARSSTTANAFAEDWGLTRAPDGNFELDGTALTPGKPITFGTGTERTRLAITSIQEIPAIVIDGSLTMPLAQASRLANSTLPFVTHASTPPATPSTSMPPIQATSASVTSDSVAVATARMGYVAFLLAAALLVLLAS